MQESGFAERRISIVLPQTRIGTFASLVLCAFFGLIYVKGVGWGLYLTWYAAITLAFLGRQWYFDYLLKRYGKSQQTLRQIVWVSAISGVLSVASLPLFAHSLSLSDLAVLSAVMVGWTSLSVAVLWVDPRAYAVFVITNLLLVFVAWPGRAEVESLLALGVSLIFGGLLMANLARLVSRQQYEMERASQGKTRFLAAANHDLRQPAHALGLFMSRLKQEPANPKDAVNK